MRILFKKLGISIWVTAVILVGIVSSLEAQGAQQFDIEGPANSGSFGSSDFALPNGNIVIIDRNYVAPGGFGAGAAYLYAGATGTMISQLKGDALSDGVGNGGISILPSGNYLVLSPNWHTNAGAVTFCSKDTGCSGIVSASNSLVGTLINDRVGQQGVTVLEDGDFVINSTNWSSTRGAVTWGNGNTGVFGEVSALNSLVGVVPSDHVGAGTNGGITQISNGNYIVRSPSWSNNRGASTFCIGTTGCVGTISSSNSLTGTTPSDLVGSGGIIELTNGNYLVCSHSWSSTSADNVGAVTWGSGVSGVVGEVSESNSLIGSNAEDQISNAGAVTVLANGNYVVRSTKWNGFRGAATFGNGTIGMVGVVSMANSLVGNEMGDSVGAQVAALTNGNYVVVSPSWSSQFGNAGAATFGNGVTGVAGTISVSNSLIGDFVNNSVGSGGVTPLSNGNYVVQTSAWNSSRGAVTFGNGNTGVVGLVSALNSLVGESVGDRVGEDGIVPLSNSDYLICSSSWDNNEGKGQVAGNAGAVTFANGDTGIVGLVSSSNSLVGTQSSDDVGQDCAVELTNGNYVVISRDWNGDRGAATFGSGATGVTGAVSAANSLVGTIPNDYVPLTVIPLVNGNYVVASPDWHTQRGAVTFGNGQTGVSGEINSANSLVGATTGDRVGGGNNERGPIPLPNGNYVVSSTAWNEYRGAVTLGNGITGINGFVSSTNSLLGSTPQDQVGRGSSQRPGFEVLLNGGYSVLSADWDNGAIVNAGAISLGRKNIPLTGVVSLENSVLGETASEGNGLNSYFDSVRDRLVVGRPEDNKVTLIWYESFSAPFDFDGDGKTDLAIFRPSPSEWWYSRSGDGGNSAAQFGQTDDRIVPADFTGDGKTDIAVWRPSSGSWFVLRSEDNSFYSFPFGTVSDIPATGDFDGDGKTDPAVFRPSSGTWFILRSSDSGTTISQFGQAGDQPVAADYDGDGKTDTAIFRQSAGEWWWRKSSDGQVAAVQFGSSTDKTVPGDYTGDGKADVAIFRPDTGFWFVLRSEDFSFYSFPFGAVGDLPAPGDFDGDGVYDATVFRPAASNWFINGSTDGILIRQFGINGDVPVPGAYVR